MSWTFLPLELGHQCPGLWQLSVTKQRRLDGFEIHLTCENEVINHIKLVAGPTWGTLSYTKPFSLPSFHPTSHCHNMIQSFNMIIILLTLSRFQYTCFYNRYSFEITPLFRFDFYCVIFLICWPHSHLDSRNLMFHHFKRLTFFQKGS